MNFRGSLGFGRKFWEVSFKQWGKTMQDDITDGVQWLIEQGIANQKRIAIYGGSYGGYAVLAGLCFTPTYIVVVLIMSGFQIFLLYWKQFHLTGNLC